MTFSDKLYVILIRNGSWKTILGGLWMTVRISALALVLGTLLGAIICLLRTRKNPLVRGIASAYIAVLRGSPVLMLLLLLYYGVFEIRRSMGMLHQTFHLFSEMNVMDNLCLAPKHILKMPRREAEKKAMELLGLVGLANCANAWPTVLSGGQQQCIAICRCLMMEPKVLLFDEPTSALDPTMVGEVLAVIRMLARRNMGMIIVTHEMNFAREVADRVLFFADGGIYEQGTPAEIFDAPKREKTISFIRKIKYFTYEIRERQFDLMRMQGGIQSFGEKYGMAPKHIFRLRLCCEELIYELLAKCYPNREDVDLNLSVSHAELDDTTQIDISCGGARCNPFEQEEDSLGVTILKKMAGKLEYHYTDNRNRISIEL